MPCLGMSGMESALEDSVHELLFLLKHCSVIGVGQNVMGVEYIGNILCSSLLGQGRMLPHVPLLLILVDSKRDGVALYAFLEFAHGITDIRRAGRGVVAGNDAPLLSS
jgi:hypothetical protein